MISGRINEKFRCHPLHWSRLQFYQTAKDSELNEKQNLETKWRPKHPEREQNLVSIVWTIELTFQIGKST